jgi:hypothetical protein
VAALKDFSGAIGPIVFGTVYKNYTHNSHRHWVQVLPFAVVAVALLLPSMLVWMSPIMRARYTLLTGAAPGADREKASEKGSEKGHRARVGSKEVKVREQEMDSRERILWS